MIPQVDEVERIAALTRAFSRSPLQCNATQESDAELIRVSDDLILAFTTDTIVEELASGLYGDPWLAGWMAVMANFSDIAAVGARPLGILLAETFPHGMEEAVMVRVQDGIRDACAACGSFVLGGDTNTGECFSLTGTAAGLIAGGRPLTRRGIVPGDRLYVTGPLGGGNAFAAHTLAGLSSAVAYRPVARLREGADLRPIARACMDTSDGLLATLDQLGRVNGTGFALAEDWPAALEAGVHQCARLFGIPPWVFLAGPHGEFELVLALPPEKAPACGQTLAAAGTTCLYLGMATQEPGIRIPGVGLFSPAHSAAIRNLPPPDAGCLSAYCSAIVRIGARTINDSIMTEA